VVSNKQYIFKFNPVYLKSGFRSFPKFYWLLILLTAHCSLLTVSAQKLAVLNPEKNSNSQVISETLETRLSKNFKIIDSSLAEAVAMSSPDKNVFNLSIAEAQNLGNAIGCDFFIVQKAGTLRRASLSKPDYYESYAAIYLVDSRTGHLVFWKLLNSEAVNSVESEKALLALIDNLAQEISAKIKSVKSQEFAGADSTNITEYSADTSEESKDFRPPLPYRRIKPPYTNLANLYSIAATVDAMVDLDEKGNVLNIEITRWAGYGLDESVAETIKRMQWRPAERDGKTLPIRILLRYNFKKLKTENDEQ
jgi:hypothetical protein